MAKGFTGKASPGKTELIGYNANLVWITDEGINISVNDGLPPCP